MAVGEVIYALNKGDKPLTWKWANQKYTLPPGQTVIVPWEAMCLWMGNPDLIDVDERRRFRTDEFQRLQFKYGCHAGAELWDERKPNVECMTLSEERIITVVDDPDGTFLTPDVQTKHQTQLMQERMNALEKELVSLRRAQGVQDNADAAEATGVRVTEDSNPKLGPAPDPSIPSPMQRGAIHEGDSPRVVTEDRPSHFAQ